MIRIYLDDPGGLELVVRGKGADLSTTPICFAPPELRGKPGSKLSMSLPWVALLVVASVGAGYVASPHGHGAHAATSPAGVALQAPPDFGVPPGGGADATAYMPPPNSGAQAVATALATPPSVIPAPAPSKPASEPGTAAFGLQP